MLISVIKNGNKILLCGNGGSAADSQHIAGEFINRFRKDRIPLPATIGFTGDGGGKLKDFADICIRVPSLDTPRIQEAHI